MFQELERYYQARQLYYLLSANRQCPTGTLNFPLCGFLSWVSTLFSRLGHYSFPNSPCLTNKVWQELCLPQCPKYVFLIYFRDDNNVPIRSFFLLARHCLRDSRDDSSVQWRHPRTTSRCRSDFQLSCCELDKCSILFNRYGQCLYYCYNIN